MNRHRRSRKVLKMGVPSGRGQAALNRGLYPGDDASHGPGGPFPYEWWYFDAVMESGHSVVAIIWSTNYSKPWRRQCTIQLSIYQPDGENIKHYVFPPASRFKSSASRCDLCAGSSYVRGVHPTYEVHVEVEGDSVDLLFEAETPGWMPGSAVNHLPCPRYKTMGWLVPVPRARVTGSITVRGVTLEVSGHGYHDHNWGEALIVHFVDNWHWGHLVQGELGIIWADIRMCKELDFDRSSMFLLSEGDSLIYESAGISVAYGGWTEDPSHLLPYPRVIDLSFGGTDESAEGELTMRVNEIVETQDLLEMTGLPPLVRRMVHRYRARPYYFRWRSSVEGRVRVRGSSTRLAGETIHEQMIFRGDYPVIGSAGKDQSSGTPANRGTA